MDHRWFQKPETLRRSLIVFSFRFEVLITYLITSIRNAFSSCLKGGTPQHSVVTLGEDMGFPNTWDFRDSDEAEDPFITISAGKHLGLSKWNRLAAGKFRMVEYMRRFLDALGHDDVHIYDSGKQNSCAISMCSTSVPVDANSGFLSPSLPLAESRISPRQWGYHSSQHCGRRASPLAGIRSACYIQWGVGVCGV